jgi:pimeloyl-ACP methyl ester carboxylesterase
MKIQNPVIVIPGITASDLLDDYPLSTETLWSMVFHKDHQRISLHPDDLRYEAIEPAHVFPGRAFDIYDDLIKSLRHELSSRADESTPVFAFPYDWRADIRLTAKVLGTFVDEVIARTLLLKHYGKAQNLKVDLVGHSMGGLIISEYLSQSQSRARIGKVATIGTPYLGAVEALVKMTTGMSLLCGDTPSEREREAARVTPAVYQLLPFYQDAVVDTSGKPVDLFDRLNMQPSIVESLTEFVRLYAVGTPSTDRRSRAEQILDDLLLGAKNHRDNVTQLKLGDSGVRQEDWLAIVGVGQRTRVQVTVTKQHDKPRFVINEGQFVDELEKNPESLRTGDGTVPLLGAIPPFLPQDSVVCVMPKDFGLLEIRDRMLVQVGGFHGLLPSMNLVQHLVVKHLWPKFGGEVWGRPLPGVTGWHPPIDAIEKRSYPFGK